MQRLDVVDDSSDCHIIDDDDSDGADSLFGCWSSPGYLAINMMEENDRSHDEDVHAALDSWMKAAHTLSASIDEVSLMIKRKAASYVSSTDTLIICFNAGNSTSADGAMTNADRSILETTVASFAAGMTKQVDSLRQTVAVEGDHPFIKTADDNADTSASHNWASGPIGHRAGIASCLMQRLKSEIMDPMTNLQSQRGKSMSKKNTGGGASEIAQNPLRLFRLGAEDSLRRAMPPAPWEVGSHDAEKDQVEREQENEEFLSVYFDKKEKAGAVSPDDVAASMLPPPSVMRLMDLPDPSPAARHQLHQASPQIPSASQLTHKNVPAPHYEEEEHIDQLQRESAQILATYQHSDLEGVQKVERGMVEITSLLSQFTDLITEQVSPICFFSS